MSRRVHCLHAQVKQQSRSAWVWCFYNWERSSSPNDSAGPRQLPQWHWTLWLTCPVTQTFWYLLRFPQISGFTLGAKSCVQLLGVLYFWSISFRLSPLYWVWNLALTSFDNLSDTERPLSLDELRKVVIWVSNPSLFNSSSGSSGSLTRP